MPLYPAAVKRLIPPGPHDPRISPRLAILHVDAGDTYDLHDYFATRSGGVESHFHIAKDGTVFQYRDTDHEADANSAANPFAVSIETQGLGSGEWTPQQLTAIKALLVWLAKTHNIPMRVANAWNGSGVGYHTLYMAEWAGGPRACPGPDRIRQFRDVLVPWFAAGTPTLTPEEDDMALSPEDKAWIDARLSAHSTHAQKWHEQRTLRSLAALLARKSDVTAAEIAAALPDALAADVAAELAKRLES